MGGTIAFEIARQLEETDLQENEVALCVLMDTSFQEAKNKHAALKEAKKGLSGSVIKSYLTSLAHDLDQKVIDGMEENKKMVPMY